MFVIVASRYDKEAQMLVKRWSDRDVRLLTCGDLSLSGWRHHPTYPHESVAVVSGETVAVGQITGVLSRLPGVYDHEIPQIMPTDRPYVAAEMTAFLSAWLNHLQCPVLNRPAATCLLGPSWRSQQWTHTAARLGIPVCAEPQKIALHAVATKDQADSVAVTVIGNCTLGEVDPLLAQQAQQLAKAAQVNLLTVHFRRSGATLKRTFLSAELWADLSSEAIAEAIWNYVNTTPLVQRN
jgi:hypothetical protein